MKQQFTIQQLPQGLSQLKIDAHVMEPPHIRNIRMVEVDERKEKLFKAGLRVKTFTRKPRLDAGAFATAFHTILKDQVTGYELQIRKNGSSICELKWQWGQTPADGGNGWTDDVRMHVASVSKFLTAIGMVKALDSKGISYDTSIANYLPAHWGQGPNISKVTFRKLFTHRSGFPKADSATSYPFMKGRVGAGVAANPDPEYANMNFGLCRILMPILLGDISRNATFVANSPSLNDQAWDAVTQYHYKSYMQERVFGPAGVNNAGFAPRGDNRALAYRFPHGGRKGWESGDLASVAGGAGWRLSTQEVLQVLHHARRRNTILPASKFQYLLDNYFGIDQIIDTPAGKLYNKNGGWGTGIGETEQCVAYVLPDDMEAMVMVNSPISTQGFSLRGLFKDVYLGCLSE
jgi:CubicO group peptidase (beta-lactamase class C family)